MTLRGEADPEDVDMQRGPGEGELYWLLTDLVTIKVASRDTNNAFTMYEVSAGPEIGPPPHLHEHCDETFYVLEGTYDFSLAGRPFSAGPGSVVYLPKGVLHTHQAGSGKTARALVMQTPGGVDDFIKEAGRAVTNPAVRPGIPEQAELVKIVAIAAKHGIHVSPPPA
jgi:quercetin dioxygenase-like cupin family protein